MALVSMGMVPPSINDSSETRKSAKGSRSGQQNGRGATVAGVKRNVTQSSSFMDALGGGSSSQVDSSKKRPRMAEKKKRRLSEEDLLGGIYNKMNKMHESSMPIDYIQQSGSNLAAAPRSPSEYKPTVSPPPPERTTKIRFADDLGHPLVNVRYFEVEEGERVNVNTLTHDQIRAMEVQMEKKALGKLHHQHKMEDKQEVMPEHGVEHKSTAGGNKEVRWRLVGVADLPDRTYGTKSLEAKNETKRQQTALEAFYMPGRCADRFEEPPLVDARPSERHKVKTIALMGPPPQQTSSTAAAASENGTTATTTAAATSSTVLPSLSTPSTTTTMTTISNGLNLDLLSKIKGERDESGNGTEEMASTSGLTTITTATVTTATSNFSLPERSKVLDLLSNLKRTGILGGQQQQQQPAPLSTAQPTQSMIYAQSQPIHQQSSIAPSQPTYQQEFYLPPTTAANTVNTTSSSVTMATSHQHQHHSVLPGFSAPVSRFAATTSAHQPTVSAPHAYVATMPPPPSTPHFSSQSAPALPVTGMETFSRMPIVVPPPPKNFEQSHHFDHRPVKPRGPFNGPVMGGYRQCRAFGTPGGCSFGDRCRYAHGDQPPPAAAGVRRNAARNEAAIASVGGSNRGI